MDYNNIATLLAKQVIRQCFESFNTLTFVLHNSTECGICVLNLSINLNLVLHLMTKETRILIDTRK